MTRYAVLKAVEAAGMLLLDAATDGCSAHHLRNDPGNCSCLEAVALRHPGPNFKNAVVNFSHHFNRAWKCSAECLDILAAFLRELLTSDELNVRHEDLLYAIYHCHTRVLFVNESVMSVQLRCVRVGVMGQAALDEARKRMTGLAQRPARRHAIDKVLVRGPCRYPSGEQPRFLASCRQCSGSSPLWLLPNVPHEVLVAAGGSI